MMTDLEAELSVALRPAADLAQPPFELDLDRARVRGLRLRRRRQGLQVGVATTATALVALLVTVPLSGRGGSTVPSASPTSTSGGTPTNDPLTTGVTFGWLPSGFHTTGGAAQGTQNDDLVAGNGKTTLFVTVLPPGSVSASTCTSVLPANSAPNGAYSSTVQIVCDTPSPGAGITDEQWVVAPGPQVTQYAELQWRMANGRQASLYASPGDSDQLTTMMLQVAQNVSLGAARALPMPFHLAKPPAGLQLAYAYGSQGADGTIPGEAANGDPVGMGPAPGIAAGIEYGGVDATTSNLPGLELAVEQAVPDSAFPTEYQTQINATPATPADTRSTKVDGHPARIVTQGGFEALVVHGVNGFDIRLAVGGAQAMSDVNAVGGIVAYFHTITFYDTDPGTWTVNVLGK